MPDSTGQPPTIIDTANRHLLGGEPQAAARVLADVGIDALMAIDLADLRALVARLGTSGDESPNSLLAYARVLELSLHRDERSDLLGHLKKLAENLNDSALERAVLAEQARDHVRNWEVFDAIDLAKHVLENIDRAAESGTRARALAALGAAHAYRREPGDVSKATDLLREAAALSRQLGVRTWEAHALAWLGYATLYPEGDDAEAIAAHERALEIAVPGSRLVSLTRVSFAAVLLAAGRLDDAVPHLEAMEEEARSAADARGLAWAAWTWARHAALRNDPVVLAARLDEVERHRTEWFDDSEGLKFLAEASELAQAVGDEPMARRYLERAEERARIDDLEHMVIPARAAYEARFGDPHLAAELLDTNLSFPAALRRDRWLVEVLHAVAADRRGDVLEARRHAAAALDQASTMRLAHLLPIREPVFASRVIELAIAGGSAAASDLGVSQPPRVRVSLFGRFRVVVGGEDRTPAGQSGTLLKLVALAGGVAPADRVIETLWPDQGSEIGRRRLRNLLNRLRSVSGPLVVRDGGLLRIPDASVDLVHVEAALDRLADWAPDGPDAVREAWTMLSGPLLGDDPYEEWAIPPREKIVMRLAGAADRMAADAERIGNDSEALMWMGRAVEQEPYDIERHKALVAAAARIGDRSRLRWAVSQAVAAYKSLDLDLPEEISRHL